MWGINFPMEWGIITSLRCWALLGVSVALSACSSTPRLVDGKPDRSGAASGYGATAFAGDGLRLVPSTPTKSPATLYREVNVKKVYIPKGKHGRKVRRSMSPRYITIHSTQNFSSGADVMRHAKALNNGKLRAYKRRGGNRIGYLTWHYTTDEAMTVQHLPTNEQGEHADFDGPGNNYSVAIEMCEHRGNSRTATIERTAKLSAWLMHKYDIPLRKVVPHYHWRRKGLTPEHKNCPHYLLDNGHPGAKWQWFLAKVNKHYKSISAGSPNLIPRPTAPAYGTAVVATAPRSTSSARSSVVSAPRPTSARVVQKKPAPRPSSRPSSRYHTVKRGDTLYGLARRYKTSVGAIQRANGLKGSLIGLGKRLRIPVT